MLVGSESKITPAYLDFDFRLLLNALQAVAVGQYFQNQFEQVAIAVGGVDARLGREMNLPLSNAFDAWDFLRSQWNSAVSVRPSA
jgi:hypothetical protein